MTDRELDKAARREAIDRIGYALVELDKVYAQLDDAYAAVCRPGMIGDDADRVLGLRSRSYRLIEDCRSIKRMMSIRNGMDEDSYADYEKEIMDRGYGQGTN